MSILKLAPDYRQPKGLHFAFDSIRLAQAAPRALLNGRAADLGAGSGVVGLEALNQGRLQGLREMVFLERELAFSDSLAANLTLAQKSLKTRLRLVLADLREVTPTEIGGLLDYALFNPPWREPSKRGSPIPAKRAMRESLFGDLATLLTAAAALIKPGGGLTLSWPGAALARLMTALALVPQLKLSWLKTYRKAGSRFTLLLVGLIKSFN